MQAGKAQLALVKSEAGEKYNILKEKGKVTEMKHYTCSKNIHKVLPLMYL